MFEGRVKGCNDVAVSPVESPGAQGGIFEAKVSRLDS